MPGRLTLHPTIRAVLLAALLVAIGLLFPTLVTLLLALLIAIILAIPLAAFGTRLHALGVPRWLGCLLGLVLALGAIALLGLFLVPPISHQVTKFIDALPHTVNVLTRDWAHLTHTKPRNVGASLQRSVRSYTSKPASLLGTLASIGSTVAGALAVLVLIVLTAFYMAINPEPLVNGAVRLFPPRHRGRALSVLERIRGAWIGWMLGVGASMLVLGAVFYGGLALVGLPFAEGFAVFSAVSVVVPYLGALASGLPPILFALTISPTTALEVLAVYIVAHQVEGNIIGPLIMSRAVKLHPAVIVVGVVVIGDLLGLLGLVVAVPIIAAFLILVDDLWVRNLEAESLQALEHPGEPEPAVARLERP